MLRPVFDFSARVGAFRAVLQAEQKELSSTRWGHWGPFTHFTSLLCRTAELQKLL